MQAHKTISFLYKWAWPYDSETTGKVLNRACVITIICMAVTVTAVRLAKSMWPYELASVVIIVGLNAYGLYLQQKKKKSGGGGMTIKRLSQAGVHANV